MYYDYHVHSNFSNDCSVSMERTIKHAIDIKLKEVCFTDHVDYDCCANSVGFDIDYDKYFRDLDHLIDKYKHQLVIKKGVEFGVQPHLIQKYNDDSTSYPFDFIICSVHTANRKDLFNEDIFRGISQREGYEKYYGDLLNIVKNFDNFCVLGHLDIIRRYGSFAKPLDNYLFMDFIEEILKTIIYKGRGIEVNTSGFRYNLNSTSPTVDVLKLYKQLNGDIITTGSDSHIQTTLSDNFDYVYDLLKNIGFKYICTFKDQKPSYIKIV